MGIGFIALGIIYFSQMNLQNEPDIWFWLNVLNVTIWSGIVIYEINQKYKQNRNQMPKMR